MAEKPFSGTGAAGPSRGRTNIIRIAETNLDGGKPVRVAIRGIPGMGFMFSNAVATVSGMGDKPLETLSQEEVKKLVDILQHPEKHSIPSWMYNRRKGPIKGEDKHISASILDLTKKMDINEMKKLRIYKGVRHSLGLPVRGQRTRGSFRKGKAIGVKRGKQQPARGKK